MFEQTFKNIDDVLWKETGCSSELDHVEQTSWMLFLKYLDDLEGERAVEAELVSKRYDFIIDEEHQWSRRTALKKPDGSFDHHSAYPGSPPSPASSCHVQVGERCDYRRVSRGLAL